MLTRRMLARSACSRIRCGIGPFLGQVRMEAVAQDGARLSFTMNATVTYSDSPPEPLPDQLPPGWVRILVSNSSIIREREAFGAAGSGKLLGMLTHNTGRTDAR